MKNEKTPLLTGTPAMLGLLGTTTPATLSNIATRVGILSQSDLNALLTMPQISTLDDTATLKQAINLALALSQETQSRERERSATTLTRCVVNPILGMGMLANIITILMLVDKQPDGTLAMILGLLVLQVVIAAGMIHINGGASLCRKGQKDKLVTPLMREHLSESQQQSLDTILGAAVGSVGATVAGSGEVSIEIAIAAEEPVLQQLSTHIKTALNNMVQQQAEVERELVETVLQLD